VSRRVKFEFRLYVATDAQNSVQAINNLRAFCHTYLPERHEIEVVDVYKEPRQALADGIFMTPTLLKLAPLPTQRIVGTLKQTQTVLNALGIEGFAS